MAPGMAPIFMQTLHQLPSRASSPAPSRSASRSSSPTRSNPNAHAQVKHSGLSGGLSTSPMKVTTGDLPGASGSAYGKGTSPTSIKSPIAFPGATRQGPPGGATLRTASPSGITRSVSPNPSLSDARARTQSSPVPRTGNLPVVSGPGPNIPSTFTSTPSSSSHLQSPSATRLAPLRPSSPSSPSRFRDADGSIETWRQVCPTCGRGLEPGGGNLLNPGGGASGRKSPVSPVAAGKGKKLEDELEEKRGKGEGESERGRTRTSISLASGAGFTASPARESETLLPAFGGGVTSSANQESTPRAIPSSSTPTVSRQNSTLAPIPEVKSPALHPATPATSPPSINPLHPSAAPGTALATKLTSSGKVPKALPDVKTRAQEWGKLRALAMSISLGRVEPSEGTSGKVRDGTPPGFGRVGVGKGMISPTLERAFSGSILHATVVEALKRQGREESKQPSGSRTTSPTRVVGFSPVIPSSTSSPSVPSTPSMPDHTDGPDHTPPGVPSVIIRRSSSIPHSAPGSRTSSPSRSGTISPIKAGDKHAVHHGGRSRAGSNASLREKGESETVEVLRKALLKVLDDAEDLSSRHETLLTTQLEIENNLKIARSNLVMAEMNAEMLEEALKRGVGGEAFGYTRQGKTPNAAGVPGAHHSVSTSTQSRPATRPGTPTGMTPRASIDGTNTPSRGTSPANGVTQSPAITRRRSGSETPTTGIIAPTPRRGETLPHAEPTIASSLPNHQTAPGLKRSSTVTGARPSMNRSNSVNVPGQVGQSGIGGGVSMNSVSGFMRKSIEKTRPGSGLMRELSQGLNINLPESFSELQTLVENNLPMPSPSTSSGRNDFFSQLGMSRPEGAASTPSLGQTGDPRRVVSGASQSARQSMEVGPSAAEIQKLRGNFAASQTTVKALTGELDIIRKSKESLEAELETLSQALFEEANKMVAEERKKRAELEEEARDAAAELDALKRAMQVMAASGQAEIPPSEQSHFALGEDEPEDGPDQVAKGNSVAEKASPRSDFEEPNTPGDRERTASEVEALMKRMEEDFGKL